MMDRRTVLAGSAAMMGLMACGQSDNQAGYYSPGRGWIVSQSGNVIAGTSYGEAVIKTGHNFSSGSPFRIASITKLIVAMAIYDAAQNGQIDLAAPVADSLPNVPDGLTLDHLLSHRSGLKDPEVYWADIQTDIRTLYDRQSFTHKAGTFFRYANLNYGLAATIVETLLQMRFDQFVGDWLSTHNLDAGLNWSGVSAGKRVKAAALYREDEAGDHWIATVDSPEDIPKEGPTFLGRDGSNIGTYKLGRNGTLFSPQGGMRMSLSDLIKIGEILHNRPKFHQASWIFDGANGDDEDAHFLSFGSGSYVYSPDISPIPGVRLVGHLGWAYGAHTGLFIIPGTDISFAFARLGSGDDDATMTHEKNVSTRANQFTVHQALFDEVAPSVRTLISAT